MKTVKLEEVTLSITDGKHGDCEAEDGSGYYFISCKDVHDGIIDYSNARQITADSFSEAHKRTRLAPNDILLTNSGTIGRMALVQDTPETQRTTFQKSVAIIKPDTKTVIPSYLYYKLQNCVLDFINQSNGSAQKNLLLGTMRNFKLDIPEDLSEQEYIASLLSAYDELIENNQKQIKLLEEAAQRLYKEWFIDLRFPGHENTPIVDGVPEGWKIANIGSLCSHINAGGTPSRSNKNYWDNPTVKWYKTGELQDCWLLDSDEMISQEGLERSSAKTFPQNTILMAIYASPTLGRLGVLSSTAACNQAALCLLANEEIVSWQWLYSKLYELRDDFNAVAKGAGQQNISAETVKKKEVVLPPRSIINGFTVLVSPMYDERLLLQKQIRILSDARDRMLPKLMNGEIEV